jgi:hypothetical protein
MADICGERITNTFQFKHHAIPVLEITAINRIIDATARLTAAIAGIQDAPPNEMEAIQSLCTFLLSKVALLPPPTPRILPTPQEPTPLVDIDNTVIIWNPQLVQPSLPPFKRNTNDIIPNRITPAIVEDNSDHNSPIPITAHAHLVTISLAHCKTVLSHSTNCGYALPI